MTRSRLAARQVCEGDRMMNEHELIEEMARILDGCMPLLEKAAETEARQEAGKTLRKVTHQKRLNMATRLLTIADTMIAEGMKDE